MTDYISREAAIEAVKHAWAKGLEPSQYIEILPAADVAPVVHEKRLLDRWPSWPHRECSRCKIMIPRTKEVPD